MTRFIAAIFYIMLGIVVTMYERERQHKCGVAFDFWDWPTYTMGWPAAIIAISYDKMNCARLHELKK